MKIHKKQGVSNFQFAVILLVSVIIFFVLLPKFFTPTQKNTPSEVKQETSSSPKDVPYASAYNKGMAKAREIVAASKERNP